MTFETLQYYTAVPSLTYSLLPQVVEVCCVLVGSIAVKTVLSRILGSQDDVSTLMHNSKNSRYLSIII